MYPILLNRGDSYIVFDYLLYLFELQSLRRALTRMGAPTPLAQTLIPDNMDNSLSYSVLNYLKRLKNQAKIEFDRLCNEVISKQVAAANMTKNLTNASTTTITEGVRVIPRTPLKKDLVREFIWEFHIYR